MGLKLFSGASSVVLGLLDPGELNWPSCDDNMEVDPCIRKLHLGEPNSLSGD